MKLNMMGGSVSSDIDGKKALPIRMIFEQGNRKK